MNWSRLYKHIKQNTEITVVSCCHQYRKLAKTLPNTDDSVLEIGFAAGLATEQLAKTAEKIIAVDTSYSLVEEAQNKFSDLTNVSWIHLDARDIESLKQQIPEPDLIFIDIGGDALLGNLCSLLREILFYFMPRQLIVRNFELAILDNLIKESHLPEEDARTRHELGFTMQDNIESLLNLSHSSIASDRLFAARKLRETNLAIAHERLLEMQSDPSPKVRRACTPFNNRNNLNNKSP